MANIEGSIYRNENGIAVPYANLTHDGGVDDYDELINRPLVGGVTLTGNKSLGDLGLSPYTAGAGSLYPGLFNIASGFSLNKHQFIATGCLAQLYMNFIATSAFTPTIDGSYTQLFNFLENPTVFAAWKPFFQDSLGTTEPFFMSEVQINRNLNEIDKGTVSISVTSSGAFCLKFRDSAIGIEVGDQIYVRILYLTQLFGGTP